MSDHLPECESYRTELGGGCICQYVRACEQRVYDERNEAWAKKCRASERHALDAAREAVEALPTSVTYMGDFAIVKHVDKEVALAVIDALKEKP